LMGSTLETEFRIKQSVWSPFGEGAVNHVQTDIPGNEGPAYEGLTPGGVWLEARALRKIYGSGASAITILDGIDLSLRQGEMIAIVGPSGSGKSTLLHLLAALDTPTSGTVYFNAKALAARRSDSLAEFRNRRVGFVWQRHHLLPDFTAAENVAMPLLMRGVAYGEALRKANEALVDVGLASRARHRAAELSGGEQQRVAIARALVTKPALLLADEPTGDLDELNAVAIMDLIERLHQKHLLASILATHNPILAKRCGRVLRLEHGMLRPDANYQQAPLPVTEGEKS
jgi:lipoprotein-releasing system ATP-binding protein